MKKSLISALVTIAITSSAIIVTANAANYPTTESRWPTEFLFPIEPSFTNYPWPGYLQFPTENAWPKNIHNINHNEWFEDSAADKYQKPYSDSCGKCNIHPEECSCGECGGLLENPRNEYKNGYLYSYYKCKKCSHTCYDRKKY